MKRTNDLIKNIITVVLGMAIWLSLFFYIIFGAVLHASYKEMPIVKAYGTVIEQSYEGYELYNDYYNIELEDGNIYEIEADDLAVGDPVTIWFDGEEPIRCLYGRR